MSLVQIAGCRWWQKRQIGIQNAVTNGNTLVLNIVTSCFSIPVSSPERLQHPRPQGDALLQPVQQAQGAKEVRHPRPRGVRGAGHKQLQEQEPRVLAEHEARKDESFFQSKMAISV